MAALDPAKSLWETLTETEAKGPKVRSDQVIVRGRPQHVVGYLKSFLFNEKQARGPVSALSGGERARLLLAKLMARESNLLVLDEPTNDLDIETLDLLQELLADFDGTVLFVSHDRDFIDRVAATLPFGRLLDPAEVARAVAFLASDDSGMMTGSVVQFDQSVWGGYDGQAPAPAEPLRE